LPGAPTPGRGGVVSVAVIMRALRRRARQEDGVVLVIVALLMVVFMASAALAIDVGSFYQAQRQAQSAADAGALAAAQDLPSGTVAAAAATSYATTNFPGSTVTVSTPYNGSSQRVKVTVNATTPSFFGQFLGVTKADVSASAVAGGTGATKAAIFAYDSTCSSTGVALNGNAMTINGAIISNGSLSASGNSNSSYGPATYGGPNHCSFSNKGSGSFASTPTATTTLNPYPYDFRDHPPTCTFSSAAFTWSSDNATIPSGVYCATGAITLSGNNLNGTDVTFIAATIVVTGQNSTYTAPSDTNLLFWVTGTTTLDITSNSITIGGTIFAPTASVIIEGNAGGTGFIEANDVIINGNSSYVGSGPVTTSGSIGLVQ
jgi:Flp pilus assembly protein TadG